MARRVMLVFAVMLLVMSSCLTKAGKPPVMDEKHELENEEEQQQMVTKESCPESTQDNYHHCMGIPDFNRHN